MRNAIITLLSALMTLFLTTATAASSPVQYSLGIKGGINLFTLYGSDVPAASLHSGWRRSFGISLFFCIRNNSPLSAQIELSYARKGYWYHLAYTATAYDSNRFVTNNNRWDELYKSDYLELPLLFSYRVAEKGRKRFQLYAGPTAAVLLSASETILDNDTPVRLDLKKSTAPFDFGISAGATYELRLGHGRAIVDIRYYCGFPTTRRIDNIVHPQGQPPNRKNTGAAFMLGYAYEL